MCDVCDGVDVSIVTMLNTRGGTCEVYVHMTVVSFGLDM